MGPWSRDECKTLCWLVLAITLWGTDFLHHLHPTLIGIGLGLLLALPKVGVLDADAVKSVNFSLVIFVGGALSLGRVLLATDALTHVTGGLVDGIAPLLTGSWYGPLALYYSGFVYKFLSSHQLVMISTGLPVFLDIAMHEGLNPVAVGLVWTFASAPMLFVYQGAYVILAYSYGYFSASSLLKVVAILTVVEGLFITVLVPVYWPLIGLSWNTEPAEQHAVAAQAEAAPGGTAANHTSEQAQPGHIITSPAARTSPLAGAPLRSDSLDAETKTWASIRDSTARQDFIAFLKAFPQTRFAFAARMRLRQLLRAPQGRHSASSPVGR
jgi:hypothetical protein